MSRSRSSSTESSTATDGEKAINDKASTASSASSAAASQTAAEREFVLDLEQLTTEHWSVDARRSLLFVVGCCLPTVQNLATHLAIQAATSPSAFDAAAANARSPPESEGGEWETQYLTGMADLLKLEKEAVLSSADAAQQRHGLPCLLPAVC